MKKKKIIDINEDLQREQPSYPNQIIEFTVPVPPSVNHMYQSAGRGKRLTKEATKYIGVVQENAKREVKRTKWKKDTEGVWYVLDLYYYFPDKKVRDSHNTLKILTDALEGLLFGNDYFVLPRIHWVKLDRKYPRLEIVCYPQDEYDLNNKKRTT